MLDLRGHAKEGRGQSLFGEDPQRVTCVTFGPDGQRLASGSADLTVRLYDVTTGAELAVLRGPEQRVMKLAFSPDGQHVVGAVHIHAVWVWDTAGGERPEVIKGTGDSIALASGPTSFPWRVFTGSQALVIECACEGVAVAWFPETLHDVTPHPAGRMWAASSGGRLYFFKLERG